MKQIYTKTPITNQPKALPLNQWEIFKPLFLLLVGIALTISVFAHAHSEKSDTTVVPELVFMNPKLVSGLANKQGAVYRFPNVTTGVDAEIRLKKFSRPDIVMTSIDLPNLGWAKAFQPQFGLPGYVNARQHWYIDFECTFYEAGKNRKIKMDRFDLTSLDVDGDGVTIAEYAQFERPTSVAYSTITSLVTGVPDPNIECAKCGITSSLIDCSNCRGTGRNGASQCGNCEGSGKIHDDCDHAWDGGTNQMIQGTVLNFANIDTAATQVMATYTYEDKDKINFRMGATSASRGSNGAGIRLNSLWFRSFSLAPQFSLLPVKLVDFYATYNTKKVNLQWASAQANQFSHFVVEKSYDGKNFTEMTVVFSGDASDKRKDYTAADANIENNGGIIYYRLRMIDTDNNSTYSPICIVRLGNANESVTILTYPNPTVNELRVTLPSSWQNNTVTLTIYNQSGQVVKNLTKTAAGQTESLTINDLQPGLFIIKASNSTEQVSKRFIKIK